MRAQSGRFGTGHGGVDAEAPRFIGTGGHHPPAPRIAADNQGLAPEVALVFLLDRSKKGVHVDVNDFPLAVHLVFFSANLGKVVTRMAGVHPYRYYGIPGEILKPSFHRGLTVQGNSPSPTYGLS
jgi:hypothetical protein